MKLLRSITALLIPVCLTGCFEAYEDITVKPGGETTLNLEVIVSEPMAALAREAGGSREPFREAEKLAKQLRKKPGITRAEYTEEKEGLTRHYIWEIQLDDFRNLPDVASQLAGNISGPAPGMEITLAALNEKTAGFTQAISPAKVNAAAAAPLLFGYLPTAKLDLGSSRDAINRRLAGKNIHVTLRAPKIVNSNGTLSKGDKVASWELPVSSLIGSGEGVNAYNLRAEFVYQKKPFWKKLLFFLP